MLSQGFKIEVEHFKLMALSWASQFEEYCFINYDNLKDNYSNYAPFYCTLAVGSIDKIELNAGQCFNSLKEFYSKHNNWVFGYLGYDLKNEIEDLQSTNPDYTQFPDLFFFAPQHILRFTDSTVEIISDDPKKIFLEIFNNTIGIPVCINGVKINQRVSKEEYINNIKIIKSHLEEGDIYELNYCIEFFAENANISPIQKFLELSRVNPMPYSALLKNKDKYLISASPERFLKKEGNKLISQPMKGTARRGINAEEDNLLKETLKNSEKERSENMMIVDLVRNDLARSSKTGTTKVEELFGVYPLSNVHQMISTVTSEIRPEVHFIDAIKNAFPMGSMTGAPKISAMQIIDKLETSKRGLFSGAVGYIDPNQNFDFNVVIRSVLYNSTTNYLSFEAGSAITYDSDPEKEYEECLLKAEKIRKVFEK